MEFAKKIVMLSILIMANASGISGQENSDTAESTTGGLQFASKDVYSTQRTSFTLFNEFRNVPRTFDLRFSCDIYNYNMYGFMFRVMRESGSTQSALMHLLYIPPQGNTGKSTFEFHFYRTKNTVSFQFDTLSLHDIRFGIHASVNENQIMITCNDSIKRVSFDFPREMNLNFLFGLHGGNTDVAPMILHNVRLTLNDQDRFFWPLNEFSGNYAFDRIKQTASAVQNPIWLQDRHYYWEKLASLNSDPMAGIVFNQNNQVLIINKDSLVAFDPYTKKYSTRYYNSPRPFDRNAFFAIFNPKTQKIIGYDFHFLRVNDGKHVYSEYDPGLNTWTGIDSSDSLDQNHHHTAFWNHDTTKLIIFGGYSYFHYYNSFRRFDFDSAVWEKVEFSGDEVFPRTHTAIGRNRYTGKYYLYGGFGNREGSQSMEGRYFYDLYEIDPETRSIRLIWSMAGPEFDFVPRGNLIFNADKPVCYALGNPPIENSSLRLYEISLDRPEIRIVSDSIPVIFSDMSGNAFLFHNREHNELYCVTRETTNNPYATISIYRLNFPPEGIQHEVLLTSGRSATPYIIIITALIVLAVLTVVFAFRRRQKVAAALPLIQKMEGNEKFERNTVNAIWVINEFRAFDRNGHDITYRFANKVRHAFMVLFFETYFNDGINSADFSNILWPVLNKDQQKNNRGVIMNNLRKIFEDMPGISLEKDKQHWKIITGAEFFIDFLDIHKIMLMPPSDIRNEQILNYFSIGNLLHHENWEYLDPYKERYSSAAIDILMEMNKNSFTAHNHMKCIEISEIILNYFDFLNEPALIYKVKSLYILKNSTKAVAEYNKFRLRYNESISKPFHLSFDEILKISLPLENY